MTPDSAYRLALKVAFLDRPRDRDRPACHVGMQPFHHAAVELDDALVFILRQAEGGDDLACVGHLLRARREGSVARADLIRMNEGLAVKAHVARLGAFARESLGV